MAGDEREALSDEACEWLTEQYEDERQTWESAFNLGIQYERAHRHTPAAPALPRVDLDADGSLDDLAAHDASLREKIAREIGDWEAGENEVGILTDGPWSDGVRRGCEVSRRIVRGVHR